MCRQTLYVQSRTDNLEVVKVRGQHGMGFGLALYIQTDTDSYLQLPFSHLCSDFHSKSFKFSVLDSVTREGHFCEEIHEVCPSYVNVSVAYCMSGFKGKFYLESTSVILRQKRNQQQRHAR